MLFAALGDGAELRLLEPRHASVLCDAIRANLDRLYWVDRDFSVETANARIQGGLERLSDGVGLSAGIWLDDEMVGDVGLFHFEARSRSIEIGYWIAAKAEGRGIVSRATSALIDYAFGELELRRVEIKCAASNVRSRAIPVRLGFTLEATHRRAEPVGDVWEDLLVYGLLEEEWANEKPERRVD